MSQTAIPSHLRQKLLTQAQFRCGYCHTQEEISGISLEVDHIQPESAGGLTEEINLWMACSSCNGYKDSQSSAIDPKTGHNAPLFNPRTQTWSSHFQWNGDGTIIIGLTEIGRATVHALKLNHSLIVKARRRWTMAGWHPPK